MPVIKRYANRKLYDTGSGIYVTLEDIAAMVQRGEDVEVVDHTSGFDITTLILLQVVLAQEKRLGGMLPEQILTRLIQSGDDALGNLRESLQAFLNPNRTAEEEISRRVAILVQEGSLSAKEGTTLENLLLDERLRKKPVPPPPSTEQPAAVSEVVRLQRMVEDLEKQLRSLQA